MGAQAISKLLGGLAPAAPSPACSYVYDSPGLRNFDAIVPIFIVYVVIMTSITDSQCIIDLYA